MRDVVGLIVSLDCQITRYWALGAQSRRVAAVTTAVLGGLTRSCGDSVGPVSFPQFPDYNASFPLRCFVVYVDYPFHTPGKDMPQKKAALP